jgi:hypothetical protein
MIYSPFFLSAFLPVKFYQSMLQNSPVFPAQLLFSLHKYLYSGLDDLTICHLACYVCHILKKFHNPHAVDTDFLSA